MLLVRRRTEFPAFVIAAVCVLAGSGCQTYMNPTPYVMYGDAGRAVFAQTPEAMRTPEIPVMYVTDRVCEGEGDHGPRYGFGRSKSVAYGTVTVSMSPAPNWEQLVADSTTGTRGASYVPRVSKVEEQGRFAPILDHMEPMDGQMMAKPGAMEAIDGERQGFYRVMDRWLAASPKKDVVVFVHGFNNDFEGAAVRLAQDWHLAGRLGVPILYSWPAGSGSLLRGYTHDRESGEFTNAHLKLFLLTLAACPQVERVHVVSHSRGTDVAATAVRELHAEIRGLTRANRLTSSLVPGGPPSELQTWQVLKLQTLVLAAPDMDLEVFGQRFFSENAIRAANRVVIYFSKEDSALGMSDWLFESQRRVGAVHLEDIKPETQRVLAGLPGLEIIDCRVTGYSSHSYLAEHPAALSDLILLLRDGAAPGSEARPLTQPVPGVWQLDDGYCKPGGPGDGASGGTRR